MSYVWTSPESSWRAKWRSASRSSGCVISWKVSSRSSGSEYPVMAHSAAFTSRNRPSGETIASPIGAEAKKLRKRVSASRRLDSASAFSLRAVLIGVRSVIRPRTPTGRPSSMITVEVDENGNTLSVACDEHDLGGGGITPETLLELMRGLLAKLRNDQVDHGAADELRRGPSGQPLAGRVDGCQSPVEVDDADRFPRLIEEQPVRLGGRLGPGLRGSVARGHCLALGPDANDGVLPRFRWRGRSPFRVTQARTSDRGVAI